MVTVKIDAKRAFRKLNRANRLTQRASLKTVTDMANLGKFRAKEIAPFYTGRTARMIRKIVRKTNYGDQGVILSPNPTNYWWGENSIVKREFGGSLVKFLNDPISYDMITDKKGHRYMFKTTDYLNRIKNKVAEGNFNKINLK